MNIALFFGSFNPIHIGHLIIAQTILDHNDIDKVWFVVSPQNPFKKKSTLLNEKKRFYLAQLATENYPNFHVSNIEFDLPKPSYTVDTLTHLKVKYPDYNFSLMIGGDNLQGLHKWKNYELILENHKIYVYKRPSYDNTESITHPNIHILDVPLMEISSTMIRNRVKDKKPINFLVTDSVREEIEKGGYY